MAVRIPESPRVIYASNPLTEVICQVRFPRILRIDTELPVAFQEAIRVAFPLFSETTTTVEFNGLPPELAPPVPSHSKMYSFRSADKSTVVSLTSEFLALTTTDYRRWEQFMDALQAPLEALFRIYTPPFAGRIGLRYVDVIVRSKLGLADAPWSTLLQPWVLGEMTMLAEEHDVLGGARDLLLQLDDGARMRLRHGLARRMGEPEVAYIVDTDFYVEDDISYRDSSGVIRALQRFNGQSGRLFRSMLLPRLHHAMGPTEISS